MENLKKTKMDQKDSANDKFKQAIVFDEMSQSECTAQSVSSAGTCPDKSGIEIDDAWHRLSKQYELIDHIGSGSFGHVFKAQRRKDGKIVAIKLLKNCFKDTYSSKKLISELFIMRKLSSLKQNVFTTQLYDIIIPEDV